MIPCFQICKDQNCPHFNIECFDCDRLPDDCEHATAHLVSDRENQLIDGKPHGNCEVFYSNGRLRYEGDFINGKQEGLWRGWWQEGILKYEGHFVKDLKEGLWREWNWNGQLIVEETYVRVSSMLSKREGMFRVWFADGKPKEEGKFINQKKDGLWQWWRQDGQVEMQETYLNGKRHGLWRDYYWTGQLRQEGYYNNDEKVGLWTCINLDNVRHQWFYGYKPIEGSVLIYKHHIKKHFDQDPTLYYDNEIGEGATVFLSFQDMKACLEKTDTQWCYTKVLVDQNHLRKQQNQVTIQKAYPTIYGWQPFPKRKKT